MTTFLSIKSPSSYIKHLILTLSLLGWSLYCYKHIQSSLWLDEAASWWVAQKNIDRSFFWSEPYPAHPAYYLFLHFWIRVFGQNEWVLRIPSVLFLLLAAHLLGKLAVTVFNERSGVLTYQVAFILFLFISSRYEILIEARPYSMGLWASLLAVHLLANNANNMGVVKWLALTVYSCLALSAHLFFVTVIAVQFLIITILHQRNPNDRIIAKWIISILIAAISTGYLYAFSGYGQLTTRIASAYNTNHSILSLYNLFSSAEFVLALLCTVANLIVWFALRLVQENGERRINFVNNVKILSFLAIWAVLPIVLLGILSAVFHSSITNSRYLVFTIPAVSLMTTSLIIAILGCSSRKINIVLFVILIITSILLPLRRMPSTDWALAKLHLEQLKSDTPMVIVTAIGHNEVEDQSMLSAKNTQSWLALPYYYRMNEFSQLLLFSSVFVQDLQSELMIEFHKCNLQDVYLLCDNHFMDCSNYVWSKLNASKFKLQQVKNLGELFIHKVVECS